jgi:hypothetical protein
VRGHYDGPKICVVCLREIRLGDAWIPLHPQAAHHTTCRPTRQMVRMAARIMYRLLMATIGRGYEGSEGWEEKLAQYTSILTTPPQE